MSDAPSDIPCTPEQRDALLRPDAVREGSRRMLELCRKGGTHFTLHEEKIEDTAGFVIQVIKKNYPNLKIPFHSRWGHFRAGGVDRMADFEHCLRNLSLEERVRSSLDMVVVSVLLDAGAGPTWNYVEDETGLILTRSEGLAVASYHMFLKGDFSASAEDPAADAEGLGLFSMETLKEGFQLNDSNVLVAAESRVELMRSLGRVLKSRPDIFPHGRPGDLVETIRKNFGNSIKAPDLLNLVLKSLGEIWPGRLRLGGVNMGDTWWYAPLARAGEPLSGVVPFHKLSQWLTYSLIEGIQRTGIEVPEVEKMTGLPEYRNGGLMLDSGILELRDPTLAQVPHAPGSELVIEWRALTVALLDMLALEIRNGLGLTEKTLPLAKVLEGGTWHAGRQLAQKLRGGPPPLEIQSDGTVF